MKIELTDTAAKRITELREEKGGEGKILRIFVEAGGCSGLEYGLSFDEIKDGDVQIESNGIKLAVDAASATYLDGARINFDDGLHGKGFEFTNPNAQSTCGCGKSFN